MKYFKVNLHSLIFLLCVSPFIGFTQEDGKPLMWLSFDKMNRDEKLHIRTVEDQVTNRLDTISGTYVLLKEGIYGQSLLLDGYSAYVSSSIIPIFSGAFSVEAWIAPGAYPTNFCPVAEQRVVGVGGFSLGIDSKGSPGFDVATQNGWLELKADQKVPLSRWTHICGVYDTKKIAIWINGEKAAERETNSSFVPAPYARFYCGMSGQKSFPTGALSANSSAAVHQFFDGLVDELKVWGKALSEKDFDAVQKKWSDIKFPALEKRPLPKLSDSDHFCAVYANLEYYQAWDNFWRTSGLPDVVVSFGQNRGHFVFWRGTSYIPHWVTENGIWYNNEFNETWGSKGCHEPMSDKRCEHSQVKIVENTPARCVVHWRYALIDNWYNKSNIDPVTGWGDWTDEIYTISPDGVAVRCQTLHSSKPSTDFEWHEGIIVMGQGQGPEDVLNPEALIMSNMEGKECAYSWESVTPGKQKDGVTYVVNKENSWLTELPDANIELINTRSALKPFVIINPDDKPQWDFYNDLSRRDVSIFPWWNHWPTAFNPSDGRYAMDKDRASHSSITHARTWRSYKKSEYSETKLMLVGLTTGKASGLAALTRSWSHAPEMTVEGADIRGTGYEPSERAYQLECTRPGSCKAFQIKLNCSPNSPSIHPAFVIKNWGHQDPIVEVNGKKVTGTDSFRQGFVDTINGTDLVLWFDMEFEKEIRIKVVRK
ncbi:MAG: LamG domain-containing protein [Prolixibacteraceae bacterium]